MTHTLIFDQVRNPAAISDAERQTLVADPQFGHTVSDHMATERWSSEQGWHSPSIVPYGPFSLHPRAAVLHYGQAIFEGMKARRDPRGAINLFRPRDNAFRFAESARRLAMPEMPADLFIEAVTQLTRVEAGWVGSGSRSLYLRPFMFGNEPFIGIRSASAYTFAVIAAPVGDYFGVGDRPLSIWVTDDYTRASSGGTGAAKCSGNYAGAILAQQQASANDCDQVLFLDAVHRRFAEELGGMNVFFILRNGTVITPPLGGTILPGVTRDSIIRLCLDRGLAVQEQPYAIDQIYRDANRGDLLGMFACGTAATVHPIGSLVHSGGRVDLPGDELVLDLRRELLGIQSGEIADRHGWLYPVC